MDGTTGNAELIVIIVLGITSLFIPVAFILLWGPQRFEKKEKH